MFQVFDGEKPADSRSCNMKEGLGWDNSKFQTWEEAVTYANLWLGMYGPGKYEVNKPYYYYSEEVNPELHIIIKEV